MIRQTEGDGRTGRADRKKGKTDKWETEESNGSRKSEGGVGVGEIANAGKVFIQF